MPSNPAALEALRKLSAQPYKPTFDSSSQDPTVGRYLAQQDIKGGVEDQLVNATKARGYAASGDPSQVPAYEGDIRGLQQLLGNTEDDIQSSPITTGIKQAADYGDQDRSAILAGFRGGENQNHQYLNPVQQAHQYQLEQERNKLQQPLDVAKINAQGGVEAEKVRAQGGLDVANAKGSQIEAAMNTAFATGKPIRSLNPSSGAVSFAPPPPQVNQALLSGITKARQDYENAKQQVGPLDSIFGGRAKALVDTRKAALDQAIENGLAQYPASDPSLINWVHGVLKDPAAEKMSLDEILQHDPDAASQLSPSEKEEITQMLNLFRGHS